MGLLFYSFGLLPCVRVPCGLYPHRLTVLLFWFAPLWRVHGRLYPHGLTVLLYWFSPLCESSLRTVSTWAYCFTLLVCSLVWESAADRIHMGLLFYSLGFLLVWESVADCIHMGLLFYSFGLLPCLRVHCGQYPHGLTHLLPCVRVRCGLYPHRFTVLLFWFSPLCESPFWTVSTWAYCFTLLVCSLVWESVADCIHMGLLLYSFGLLPCVGVRCRLYPHGLTVLLFWFAPCVRIHGRL